MDENDAGATITAVTTENATEVTVDNDHFEVADGNLKLKDGSSLDFEAIDGGTIDVTITASGDGDSATHTVTVTVNDINEAPDAPIVRGDDHNIDENAAGATVTSLGDASDPEGDDVTFHVDNDDFEIVNGSLKLKDGVSLDHEAQASVDLAITARDSEGNVSEATNITVMVNDVNEPSNVTGTVANVTVESGEKIDVAIDLTALFTDQDDGDKAVRWELSGNPSWLSLSVEYVTEDGKEKAIGHLRGEPPTTGSDSSAAHKVTLTAKDADGAAAEVDFYVIVDDGNDDVTGINLLDDGQSVADVEVDENDASGVVLGKITVDDIDHPLHPNGMHMITVTGGGGRFEIRKDADGAHWLALKKGESLDYEGDDAEVNVTITAVDRNGEQNSPADQAAGKGKYKGNSDTATFAVVINDKNDAPVAQSVGNWWVTVDDDLEAGDPGAGEGQWLKFELENQLDGDDFPAFKDQDIAAGDKLTYTISGPSWLKIGKNSGTIENVKDAIPSRGVYGVTVTATDKDGASDSVSFKLNVALSGPADDYTDDNEEPTIRVTSEPDYTEGSGEKRVGTFTVTDEDQDIPDHDFALMPATITQIVNADKADATDKTNATDWDPMNATLVDHDGIAATPARLGTFLNADGTYDSGEAAANYSPGYAAAFELSKPSKSGNTWTYHVNTKDTSRNPYVDTTSILNHERVDEIEVHVSASDGVGASDTDKINIEIEDANEKPFASAGALSSTVRRVNQTETQKVMIWIELEDIWTDDRDDPDDLTYGATTSASWIKVKSLGEWGDIKKGPDGETGGGDDLTWPSADDYNRLVGTGGPEDGDTVAIIEIDRVTRKNQGDRGTLTLTATDDDDAKGSTNYSILVTDQNVKIGSDAVGISGSAREGSSLRANFNDDKDVDLGGSASPALAIYTWSRVADGDPDTAGFQTGGTETVVWVTTSTDAYKPVQADVDHKIKVEVAYYEVFGGRITNDNGGQNRADTGLTGGTGADDGVQGTGLGATIGGEAMTSRTVSNVPDDGKAVFTILAQSNKLEASVYIKDGDYSPTKVDTLNATTDGVQFQWQVSDNGRGGWTNVAEADPDANTDRNEALEDGDLTLDDGDGKYYRVVVSYNAKDLGSSTDARPEGRAIEEIASQAIRVGDIKSGTAPQTNPVPTVSGSANPGGTLTVNGTGVDSVQWQKRVAGADQDDSTDYNWDDLATGASLSVTSAHAGATIRAVVTYEGDDGATSVVLADFDTVASGVQSSRLIGGAVASVRPVAVKNHTVEASVMGTGHAPWAHLTSDTNGLTVNKTETVDLASLFQDPDTPGFLLTFSADNGAGLTGSTETTNGGTYTYADDANLVVLERGSGKLTYVSDKTQNHDGDATDGAGNMVTLTITASDRVPEDSPSTANLNIRINVAPTGIDRERPADSDIAGPGINDDLIVGYVSSGGDAVGNAGDAVARIDLNENESATGNEVLAELDVLDQNASGSLTARGHKFGAHTVTVSGDDRFVITNTGDGSRDSDGNGSTWQLRVKPGAKFDFEADDKDGNPFNGITEFKLTLVATDGGGLSTPTPHGKPFTDLAELGLYGGGTWLYKPIQVTVRIIDDTDDNVDRPGATEVPGLKDNETTDPDNELKDDNTDGDTDGGRKPPPPGTSIGIVEDFMDNMGDFEQDLFEDFMLVIDDAIDVA